MLKQLILITSIGQESACYLIFSSQQFENCRSATAASLKLIPFFPDRHFSAGSGISMQEGFPHSWGYGLPPWEARPQEGSAVDGAKVGARLMVSRTTVSSFCLCISRDVNTPSSHLFSPGASLKLHRHQLFNQWSRPPVTGRQSPRLPLLHGFFHSLSKTCWCPSAQQG